MSADLRSRRAVRRSLRTNFSPGPRYYVKQVLLQARRAAHLPAYLLGGELDRPIFVIGAPRSGTWLLYAILRASPRAVRGPGEYHQVWEADHHPALTGWTSNVLDASDATPEVTARIRRSFFLITGTRNRLVDKTPRNSLRVPFVDAIFPDARYVYLQRDGRDNVNSLINAWRTSRYRSYLLPEPHSITGVDRRWWKFVLYPGWRDDLSGPLEVVCAKQWKLCNDRALEAGKQIGRQRWMELRYEDLVAAPREQFERLAAFLDLPYDTSGREQAEAAARTLVNVVTPPERGKWRRENPQEVEAVLEYIAPTMEALGYE